MHQLLAGPSIGFELIGDNAMERIKQSLSSLQYSTEIPKPLRSLSEREDIRMGIYCSQSEEDVERVSFSYICYKV